MLRLMVLVTALGIGLVSISVPAVEAVRQATPAMATPTARESGAALDLPALVLQPADLAAVGLSEGFGIYGDNLAALDEAAELTARNHDDDSAARVAEIATVLEDAGFHQTYNLPLGLPADTPLGNGHDLQYLQPATRPGCRRGSHGAAAGTDSARCGRRAAN